MSKLYYLILAAVLSGCSSVNSEGNPINRSLLIDQNLSIGIDGLPITLPKINIGFSLHFRRLTPGDEISLELAKRGIQKNGKQQVEQKEKFIPPEGPKPSSP